MILFLLKAVIYESVITTVVAVVQQAALWDNLRWTGLIIKSSNTLPAWMRVCGVFVYFYGTTMLLFVNSQEMSLVNSQWLTISASAWLICYTVCICMLYNDVISVNIHDDGNYLSSIMCMYNALPLCQCWLNWTKLEVLQIPKSSR